MKLSLHEELKKGLTFHRAGELSKAEEIYKKILRKNPSHSDTLYLYGVLAHQVNKNDFAVSLIRQAIAHNPGNHLYYDNLAEILLSQKQFNETIACCQQSLRLKKDNDAALIRMGIALKWQTKNDEALGCFREALQIKSDSVEAHFHMGEIFHSLGRQEEAVNCFREALNIEPDYYPAHVKLARLSLPGEDYNSLLRRFHDWLQPRTYIEIGVATGKTLVLARPQTAAIGVDPSPNICFELPENIKVYEITSDDFFSSHNLFEEFNSQTVDLAFIDGLHLFEQALKDFINIERYSVRNTIILIHDCLPFDQPTSSRTRQTYFWSGDIWKLMICLKKYRPDLQSFTIATSPTGLGVITNLDPESTFLEEHFDEIVSEYINLEYNYLDGKKDQMLNIVPNDWKLITKRIDNRPS